MPLSDAEKEAEKKADQKVRNKKAYVKRKANGKAQAHNKKLHKVHNKIIQEKSRVENEKRLETWNHRTEDVVSMPEAARMADEMALKPQEVLGGSSLLAFLKLAASHGESEDDALAFYIGYTGRALEVEYLRWLTMRGSCELDADGEIKEGGARKLNRPVILWSDETVITMKEAEVELDFKCVELYASKLKLNARRIECALQERFQNLSLGVRLWRGPDKGAKYDREGDQLKVHKVFLTYSPRVVEMLREGTIKVNH